MKTVQRLENEFMAGAPDTLAEMYRNAKAERTSSQLPYLLEEYLVLKQQWLNRQGESDQESLALHVPLTYAKPIRVFWIDWLKNMLTGRNF